MIDFVMSKIIFIAHLLGAYFLCIETTTLAFTTPNTESKSSTNYSFPFCEFEPSEFNQF